MNAIPDKIVILQPQYLPWGGFFDQIRLCDIFVHFDDVQLPQGRHFTNRVQIKTSQGQKWLTVPIVHSSRGLIKDVQIDESSGWRELHFETFRHNLAKSPYYADVTKLLDNIYSFKTDKLSEFNINAIESITQYLGLNRKFLKSSDLLVSGSSSLKLLNIVKLLGGKTYLSGHGAKNYLEYGLFENANIEVEYINYHILPYQQFHGEFTPFVSVIDLIAHNGTNSINLLKGQTVKWRDFIHESSKQIPC
jgi:hypothetical protein